LGLGGGYNLVDPGTNSTFQQLQGRVVWLPATKLSFQLSGGVHFQQFLLRTSRSETGMFPLYEASVVYQIFAPTALSLSAGDEIGNSTLTDLFTQTTSVNAGLRQRLFGHFYLDVRSGYNLRDYRSISRGLRVRREDEYVSVYTGLSTVLFKKLNAAVFYRLIDNSSTVTGLSFDSTQSVHGWSTGISGS